MNEKHARTREETLALMHILGLDRKDAPSDCDCGVMWALKWANGSITTEHLLNNMNATDPISKRWDCDCSICKNSYIAPIIENLPDKSNK